MDDTPDDDEVRRQQAEGLLVDWFLHSHNGGEAGSFEDLLAQHPRLEPWLRRLHARLLADQSLLLGPDAPRLADLLGGPEPGEAPPPAAAVPGADPSRRYVVRGRIAEGGMGTILLAWDQRLRREVALKLLTRHGSETPQGARARFLTEAYVTARLDHPGIVPVHDLGGDSQGRPFFAMKLVDGINVREAQRLLAAGAEGWTLNRAVGVLARVAEAVAYAHSKRVLHRDIKPDNIMVGRFGETFLMDWGLARVLDRDAPEPGTGDTPPEDGLALLATADLPGLVGEEPAGADTRPDSWLVTQDGKVLGTPVYMSPEQARGEIERVDERSDIWSLGAILYHLVTGHMPRVRPGEAPWPLTVLLRARTEPLAPARELAPGAPPTLLAICDRALAPDPRDRYRLADELAAALRDYLEDISAGREEARRQAARASHLLDFLLGVLGSADPASARGRDVTVREVLARAAERARRQPPGNAPDDAHVRAVLGRLYRELGQFAEALEHLQAAHAGLAAALGARHPDTLSVATDLALVQRRLGRADEAEALLVATQAAQREVLGARHPDTLRSLDLLAALLHRVRGRHAEAERLYRAVLEGRRAALGRDDPATFETQARLAIVLADQHHTAQALALLEEAAAGLSLLHGDDHPATLVVLSDLARLLSEAGRLGEAERLYRRTLEAQRRVLGADHPDLCTARNNLGMILLRQGRPLEALAELRGAADAHAAALGEAHPRTLSFRNNVACALLQAGRAAEAAELLAGVLRHGAAGAVPDPAHAGRYRSNLGRALLELGRADAARAELEPAHAVLARHLVPDHPWVQESAALLALARTRAGPPGA